MHHATEPTEPAQSKEHDDGAFAAWLRQTHRGAHSRRTAERNAAFLVRQLKPGMSVLDIGCGPGSITLGLARAVSLGEVVGIDVDQVALDVGRESGRELSNLRFQEASVYDLPFELERFDVVFAHAVFQHLDDPTAAAREMRRVVKPGGLVALADADYGGSIVAPSTPALEGSLELMEQVRPYSGGDPRIGRRLGTLLADAGLGDVACSATAAVDGTTEASQRTGRFWADYFAAPEFVAHVTRVGWSTAGELSSMSAAWEAWAVAPGAFWARFWCEATGRAPVNR